MTRHTRATMLNLFYCAEHGELVETTAKQHDCAVDGKPMACTGFIEQAKDAVEKTVSKERRQE